MNREEFMKQLECLLWDIPENDRIDAIAYYNDYFNEAGKENEAQVIRELGSPEKVAAIIKDNMHMSGNEQTEYTERESYKGYDYGSQGASAKQKVSVNRKTRKPDIPLPVLIICIICAAPILLGVGGGLFGGLVGLVAALFGIILAIAVSGIAGLVAGAVCVGTGFFRIVANPVEGFAGVGIGAIAIAVGLLMILLIAWTIFKWLPALFKVCVNFCKRIFHRGQKGDVA